MLMNTQHVLRAVRAYRSGSIDLRKRRAWFDENAGEGNSPAPPTERTFTQAELDRVVTERLARARTDAQHVEARLLEALGVSDVSTAQALVAQAREIEAANLTALERAQQIADAATAEIEAARAEAENARVELLQERQNVAVQTALQAAGAINPRRAMQALLESGAMFLDESGAVQTDAIAAAVTQLQTDEAYLFQSPSNYQGFRSSAGGDHVPPDTDAAQRAQRAMENLILRRQTRG